MDMVPKTLDICKTLMDILNIVDIMDIVYIVDIGLPSRWFFCVFQGPLQVRSESVKHSNTLNTNGYNGYSEYSRF